MQNFDPYHKCLGIPPKDQPPNHYRLLGIDLFESDPDVIDAAANRQMAYIQSMATGNNSTESQKLLNDLSAAQLCLFDSHRKQDYDADLQQANNSKSETLAKRSTVKSRQTSISTQGMKTLWLSFSILAIITVFIIVVIIGTQDWQNQPKSPEGGKANQNETTGIPLTIKSRVQFLPVTSVIHVMDDSIKEIYYSLGGSECRTAERFSIEGGMIKWAQAFVSSDDLRKSREIATKNGEKKDIISIRFLDANGSMSQTLQLEFEHTEPLGQPISAQIPSF